MDTKTEKQVKEICKECRGNGFIRVPYHQAGEENGLIVMSVITKERL